MSFSISKLTIYSFSISIILLLGSVSGSSNEMSPHLFHFCSDIEGNFTWNSPYESNLNKLFGLLSYNAPPTGFGRGSTGLPPNKVNGLTLCRGDVSTSDCRSCINTAAPELRQRCPNSKAGIIWYDYCLLKYSSIDFFGKIDYQNRFYMWNLNNVSDPTAFNAQTKAFLMRLSKEATAVKKLYAAGEEKLIGDGGGGADKKLYGLVQCTRDLTNEGCRACLDSIIGELPNCCDGKQGGRVVGGSCNFRYEIYPFVKAA